MKLREESWQDKVSRGQKPGSIHSGLLLPTLIFVAICSAAIPQVTKQFERNGYGTTEAFAKGAAVSSVISGLVTGAIMLFSFLSDKKYSRRVEEELNKFEPQANDEPSSEPLRQVSLRPKKPEWRTIRSLNVEGKYLGLREVIKEREGGNQKQMDIEKPQSLER